MKILSITAQKPHSTGSGVYLTELVNNWQRLGHEQAVLAGVYKDDAVNFPEGTIFYPVVYESEELPFAITGMSDEMPYRSTRYRDVTEEMLACFETAFGKVVKRAMEEFQPDLIVCHHLYLLTAMVREWCPDKKILGISHGSDLRQICKNELQREYIKSQIAYLDGIAALHEAHKSEIIRIFGCREDLVKVIGAGYNQEIFYKTERIKNPVKQLTFAGKVTEKKGIFCLLHALEQLPYDSDALTVKIAGGYGTEEEYRKIQEFAESSKYQIQFLGVLPQKQLAEVFRQSDVFVLPSFFEGLPLVTMEAMACGCKVVCSEIPGMEKWLDENVPGHQTAFVSLPGMRHVDEPKEEELPLFEQRLAETLQKKLNQTESESPDLENVSWKGISCKMIEMTRGKEEKICL